MDNITAHTIELIVTFLAALAASSGFWLFISQKLEKKSLTTQLLLGLAHDRIIYLGMTYIQRGYITNEEYDNIHDCIFKPYEKMGGNGFAKKLMEEINKLPVKRSLLNGDGPDFREYLTKC